MEDFETNKSVAASLQYLPAILFCVFIKISSFLFLSPRIKTFVFINEVAWFYFHSSSAMKIDAAKNYVNIRTFRRDSEKQGGGRKNFFILNFEAAFNYLKDQNAS